MYKAVRHSSNLRVLQQLGVEVDEARFAEKADESTTLQYYGDDYKDKLIDLFEQLKEHHIIPGRLLGLGRQAIITTINSLAGEEVPGAALRIDNADYKELLKHPLVLQPLFQVENSDLKAMIVPLAHKIPLQESEEARFRSFGKFAASGNLHQIRDCQDAEQFMYLPNPEGRKNDDGEVLPIAVDGGKPIAFLSDLNAACANTPKGFGNAEDFVNDTADQDLNLAYQAGLKENYSTAIQQLPKIYDNLAKTLRDYDIEPNMVPDCHMMPNHPPAKSKVVDYNHAVGMPE